MLAPHNRVKEVPQEVLDRVDKAKVQLVLNHPFFASVLLHLMPAVWVDMPQGYAGVSPNKIYLNPKIGELTDKELEFVLAHEVMHPIMLYWYRMGPRDPELWNVASDAAANYILKNSGFTVPKNCVQPRYGDLPSEEIYERLLDQQPAHD